MNNINTLTTGTINGLTDLTLDTLTSTTLNSDTIDGNIIYYNRIEGNEIIVDTKLTLTNTGVIAVGDKFISGIELTYLDGVTSNIQTQINNISGQELDFQGQIDTHTGQITALQGIDVIHSNKIGELEDETGDLYDQVNGHSAMIGVLENKTYFQTRNSTATIFSYQINIPNGNIGFYNSLLQNNFYIQSNLASGNNIVLNSGSANIFLQSQNIYMGRTDISAGIINKSNLFMLANDGITWETQSSAFTDLLKQQIITNQNNILNLQINDISQNMLINALKTSDINQNMTIAFQTTQINEFYEIADAYIINIILKIHK